jgi:homogentisate 1,2-dioxygenase
LTNIVAPVLTDQAVSDAPNAKIVPGGVPLHLCLKKRGPQTAYVELMRENDAFCEHKTGIAGP